MQNRATAPNAAAHNTVLQHDFSGEYEGGEEDGYDADEYQDLGVLERYMKKQEMQEKAAAKKHR